MKIFIVLPAYNAEKTLTRTLHEIPKEFHENIILVDDASTDNTVEIAKSLGLRVIQHAENRGYGGNQKTCYKNALEIKMLWKWVLILLSWCTQTINMTPV